MVLLLLKLPNKTLFKSKTAAQQFLQRRNVLLYNIRFYSHYKQGTQMLNSTFNVYIFLRHGLLHIGHNLGKTLLDTYHWDLSHF